MIQIAGGVLYMLRIGVLNSEVCVLYSVYGTRDR